MKRFLAFLAGLVVSLFLFSNWLPLIYGVEYPRTSIVVRDTGLDPVWTDRFAETRPEMVLLGNSMLGEGIDEAAFDALVPERVLKVGLNGAASAVWHLMVKNFICAQDPPPRTVVLFFRDTFLTMPRYRVEGKYREKIDSFAGPDEVLLDRLAYLDGMSSAEYFLQTRFAMWGEREKLRDDLVGKAKFGVPAALAGIDSSRVEAAINGTFADSNMNQELLTAAQLAAEDVGRKVSHRTFSAELEDSFLPTMLDLLEERDIEVLLVRIKRRSDLEPGSRSPLLAGYMDELSSYLQARGVGFLDYSREESLLEEHFGEGDHLNEQGRALFTRIFAEDLAELRAGEDRR